MKKIMFNDKYDLTKAVLEGRKTMTRRIVPDAKEVEIGGHKYLETRKLRYKVGEVVAIAQNYREVYEHLKQTYGSSSRITKDFYFKHVFGGRVPVSNKMFVKGELMPHQIRITNVRGERLQDISDEDCLKEGIFWDYGDFPYMATKIYKYDEKEEFTHPKAAFAALINKVSGKGTWLSNPWVFVYEFELVK